MANKDSTKETADTRPQRKALGRGLGALLDARTTPAAPAGASSAVPPAALASPAVAAHGDAVLRMIPTDDIAPNPEQPRRNFTQTSLDELAASIRQHGILQPVVVAPALSGKFQLVAGERRWRAAQLAGLERIPALVKEARRDRALELALIENLQREDLNPIEAAAAFDRLAREFGLVHEEIAQRTGKDRATITNFVRLLRLPADVQQLLADGKISVGHAKALLAAPTAAEQSRLAAEIIAYDLTVRHLEKLLARPAASKKEKPLDANIRAALQEMERALGTRVRLDGTAKRGRLVIDYYSPDDLMRIYDAILK